MKKDRGEYRPRVGVIAGRGWAARKASRAAVIDGQGSCYSPSRHRLLSRQNFSRYLRRRVGWKGVKFNKMDPARFQRGFYPDRSDRLSRTPGLGSQ